MRAQPRRAVIGDVIDVTAGGSVGPYVGSMTDLILKRRLLRQIAMVLGVSFVVDDAGAQARRMSDSTAVVWVSLVPTISGGRSSIGSVAGGAAALGVLFGRWEGRLSAAGTVTPAACGGGCSIGIGGLYDLAVVFRPGRFRDGAGPFVGVGGGYSSGRHSGATSLVSGIDLNVSKRVLLRIEAKYTETFSGGYLADVENPVVYGRMRQLVISTGIGFSGPVY